MAQHHRTAEPHDMNRKPMSRTSTRQWPSFSSRKARKAAVAMDTEVLAYLVASLVVELVVLAFWKHIFL